MDRYYDRARGILNLLFVLSCFIFYSGFVLDSQLNVNDLVYEALEIIEGDPGEEEIANFPLSEFIKIISVSNDLAWVDDEERASMVRSRTLQGQNQKLAKWLDDEIQDNVQGIRFEELPSAFVHLFQEDPKTLKIRRIEYLLKGRLSSVLGKLGPIATISEAQLAIDPVLKVPGADVSLESSMVLSILSLTSCFLMLYMCSLIASIVHEIPYLQTRASTDLIFFHYGPLSILLSALWVFLPTVASAYWAMYLSRESMFLHELSAVVLIFISVYLFAHVVLCRKALHRKLLSISEESS